MVWYVPAMSPKKEELAKKEQNSNAGTDEMDYFAKVDEMRIPAQYFANLLTAGDVQPIREALAKLVALREYMRRKTVDGQELPAVPEDLGLTADSVRRHVPVTRHCQLRDRFVIPSSPKQQGSHHFDERTGLGFDDEEANFVEGCKRCNLFGGK